jgi:HAMP domain-containing protein
MKKLTILLLIAVLAGSVFAAGITITIRIPASKLAEFSKKFEAYMPNKEMMDDPSYTPDPNDPTNPPLVARYTQKQWLRSKIIKLLRTIESRGADILAKRAVINDPNTFEVTVE